MQLERQMSELANLGLKLADGYTVDDLLAEFDREEYEEQPFDLILVMYGAEVDGGSGFQTLCPNVWNFDTERIYKTGDYVKIANGLCAISGQPGRLQNVSDFVDVEVGKAWLKYTVGGERRDIEVAVDDDWVDTDAVAVMMQDLERGGKLFYSKDNGQAAVLFYLDKVTAERLNKLSNNALAPVVD